MVNTRRWVLIQDGVGIGLTFSTPDGVTLYPEAPNVIAPRVLALRDRQVHVTEVVPRPRRRHEARAGRRGRRGARRVPRRTERSGFVCSVRVSGDPSGYTYAVEVVAPSALVFGGAS